MTSCKVALVNPRFAGTFDGVPMGLLYLAAALEEAGHDVRVYDFSGTKIRCEEAANQVLDFGPRVVGITGTSPSYVEAMKLGRIIRSRTQDICLVKGGYHEKFGMWRDTLRPASDSRLTFDFAVTTDGEAQIVEIANAYAAGREVGPMAGIIKSLPAGAEGYEICEQKLPFRFSHLIPARHLLKEPSKYRYKGIFGEVKATQLMTYRGCRFRCTFCAIPTSEVKHDLGRIETEIKGLVEHGYGAVFIDDGTFTVNWERAREVCNLLHRYGLRWACQTRIDTVNEEILRHMAATGCTYVYYGLESGSGRVLKAIKKGLRLNRVSEMIQLTRSFHMKAVTSFIFGVPFEDGGTDGPNDWNASIDLILRAKPDAVVPTIFAYYPGSPAWQNLSRDRQDEYRRGLNRDRVWRWYDDGWGAIHAIEPDVGEQIRETLEARIGDCLWHDLATDQNGNNNNLRLALKESA